MAAFEIVAKGSFIIQTTSLESGHWALHWGTRWQLRGRSARLEHFSTETLFHPCWEQKTIMWSHTHNAQFLHHLSLHLYFLFTIGQQSVGGKHDHPESTDRTHKLAGTDVGTAWRDHCIYPSETTDYWHLQRLEQKVWPCLENTNSLSIISHL